MQENKLKIHLDLHKVLQFISSLLILINVFSFNRTEAFDYKSLYIQIIFCFLFLFWGFGFIRGRLSLSRNYLNKLILIFFLLNLISFFISPYKIASGLQFFNICIYIGLYFIFLNTFVTISEINKFLNLLVFSLALVSIYGILQHFRLDFWQISNQKVFSTFTNPNFFAGVLAINLPFCFSKLFLAKNSLKKFIYFLIGILVFFCLLLTKSKGGIIVGFLSGFFFWGLTFWVNLGPREEYNFKKKLLLSMIVGLVLCILVLVVKNFASTRVVRALALASLKGRQLLWQITFKMIKEHPLRGSGIGTFVLFAPSYKQPYFYPEQFIRHAWNEFLELWQELGILGLIIFMGILIFISLTSLRLIFNPKIDRQIKTVLISGLSSLWAGIVLNLGEINLRIIYLGIYFWLNLAMLAKIRELNLKNLTFPISLPPLIKGMSFVAVMFLALFLLKYVFTPLAMYKADENKFPSSAGTEYIQEDAIHQVRQYFEKIVQISPDSLGAYNNLGNIYLYAGEMDKAIDYYKKVLAINPHSLSANYNLGYAYFLEGKVLEAYKQFERCLKLNPKDLDSFFMLRKRILY